MFRIWWLVLTAGLTLMPDRVWSGDAYDAVRQRWLDILVGPTTADRTAPAVAAMLRSQADAGLHALDSMHREPASKVLWDDVGNMDGPDALAASAELTKLASRLLVMARAYGTPGAPTYHDPKLGEGLAAGLAWFLREQYTITRPEIGNWWHWQIGTPQHLLDVLTLAYDAIPDALRQRCLMTIQRYVPDPRRKTRKDGTPGQELETAANLLDKSQVAILGGVLGKDERRIVDGRDSLGPTLDYVTEGDGFYRDGSFIQHGYFAYTGNYGTVAFRSYTQLLYLLSGSAWALTDLRVANVFAFARDSFLPVLVNGGIPDALRGRKLAQRGHTDEGTGRAVVGALAILAELAPPQEAAALRSAIKSWLVGDRLAGGSEGTGSVSLEQSILQAIAANPTIAPTQQAWGARIFAAMDRAVLRGPGFSAVLSLTSPRTGSFEVGNGENLKGWWTGMGRLALYDADTTQFGHDYWATVDMLRLPGTTTDHSVLQHPQEWKQYPNPEAWVGGADLGTYAALGMAFTLRQVTGSPLQGRKAWFLLGDRILALGSGIGQGQGDTETVVDNRRLSDPAGARLLVDGHSLPNGKVPAAHWAHLQDDKAGSRTGYVFPLGSALVAERSERSGSWSDLDAYGSKQAYNNSFQVLSIPHGVPQYAYVLLPNASEAATRAAASDPGLHIEANDEQAAAVSAARHGVYAANLWQAGSAPKEGQAYVHASGPAVVVVVHRAGRLQLAVAEPTQRLAMLELTLTQAVGSLVTASPGVTVLQTEPQLRLRIDAAGAAGRAFDVEFMMTQNATP